MLPLLSLSLPPPPPRTRIRAASLDDAEGARFYHKSLRFGSAESERVAWLV